MVGTRKLARLLDAGRARPSQGGVGGRPPPAARDRRRRRLRRPGPPAGHRIELVDNRRQAQRWERDALAELRSGSVHRSGRRLPPGGTHHTWPPAPTPPATPWSPTGGPPAKAAQSAAMYALRRSDVDDLNRRARRHMAAAGLPGPTTRSTAAGRELAAGDEIVCLRNDRRLGVAQRHHRHHHRHRPAAGRSPSPSTARPGAGRCPAEYLDAGHVTHGYATTIHKAQGATVDRAFLLGSDALYREAGYVGPVPGPSAAPTSTSSPRQTSRHPGRRHAPEPTVDLARQPPDLEGPAARPRRSAPPARPRHRTRTMTLTRFPAFIDRLLGGPIAAPAQPPAPVAWSGRACSWAWANTDRSTPDPNIICWSSGRPGLARPPGS